MKLNDVYLNRENGSMRMVVNVECECTDRELWELENKVLGLEEMNGVKGVKIVEGE